MTVKAWAPRESGSRFPKEKSSKREILLFLPAWVPSSGIWLKLSWRQTIRKGETLVPAYPNAYLGSLAQGFWKTNHWEGRDSCPCLLQLPNANCKNSVLSFGYILLPSQWTLDKTYPLLSLHFCFNILPIFKVSHVDIWIGIPPVIQFVTLRRTAHLIICIFLFDGTMRSLSVALHMCHDTLTSLFMSWTEACHDSHRMSKKGMWWYGLGMYDELERKNSTLSLFFLVEEPMWSDLKTEGKLESVGKCSTR